MSLVCVNRIARIASHRIDATTHQTYIFARTEVCPAFRMLKRATNVQLKSAVVGRNGEEIVSLCVGNDASFTPNIR
jgi:NADH:ubiquinone oxidoreductase subunit F (NADH-binding)